MKANREAFNNSYEAGMESIDYFYDSIINSLEQKRSSDKQELTHLRNKVVLSAFSKKHKDKTMRVA